MKYQTHIDSHFELIHNDFSETIVNGLREMCMEMVKHKPGLDGFIHDAAVKVLVIDSLTKLLNELFSDWQNDLHDEQEYFYLKLLEHVEHVLRVKCIN